MTFRQLTILLTGLALVSCDKAKSIADKATTTVKEQIAEKIGGVTPKVDEDLQALVDQTDEGVIFRKDLPFPAKLEVRTTQRREMNGRIYHSSELEKRVETVNGTQITVTKLERDGGAVRYKLEQSSFSVPTKDDPDTQQKIANPLEQVAPSTKAYTFLQKGGAWKTDEADGFRASVLSKLLSPVFDVLLVDNALSPRPIWFAKNRLKPGDELTITGSSLPMVVAGAAKGTLKLKLESFEPVEGHPCGVFSVSGDLSRKQFPDFEGSFLDEEVTIHSGKIWCSLIHPIVLREELEAIQSFKSGGEGGLAGRGQGSVKVSVKRDWKALSP